jgi:hypothetical protein
LTTSSGVLGGVGREETPATTGDGETGEAVVEDEAGDRDVVERGEEGEALEVETDKV